MSVEDGEQISDTPLPERIALTFNIPLTLAKVPIDMLLSSSADGNVSPRVLQTLLAVRSNLERLQEVMHDFRLSDNTERKRSSTLHLPFFAAEIHDSFAPIAKARDITFHKMLDLEADTEFLLAETLKLDKIILNLIIQSLASTPKHGHITLLLHTRHLSHGTVQLRITITANTPADEAEGLPKQNLQMGRNRRNQPSNGTDTGIMLSADIARSMGGSLQVESSETGGTTYTLALRCPKAALHQLPAEKNAGGALDEYLHGIPACSLHIVENDREVAEMLQSNLKNHFTIHIHKTAEEFLLFAAQHSQPGLIRFDAIMINLMLPGMSGLELLQIIRQHVLLRTTPTLALNGVNSAYYRREALRLGVDDYISMPFDLPELCIRIRNAIQRIEIRSTDKRANIITESTRSETRIPPQQLFLDIVPSNKKEWMAKILQLIDENIAEDALDVRFLARKMAVSERQLFRLIKSSTGLSPNQIILEIRLNKAIDLIENDSGKSINDVAQLVGINNSGYFATAFKKRFNKKPSDFRKKQNAKPKHRQ